MLIEKAKESTNDEIIVANYKEHKRFKRETGSNLYNGP